MKPAWPMENWPVRPFTKFSDTARMIAMPMWLMFWKAYSSRKAGLSATPCSMSAGKGVAMKNGSQQGTKAEGKADHQVDVHAHQRGDRRVPGDRAHGGADASVEDDALEHDHQHQTGEDGDQIDVPDGDAGDGRARAVRKNAEGARVGAEEELPPIFEEEADSDGRDQGGH